MSTPATELDAVTAHRVQVLWDRQEISDVMLRFGRGLDLHDWDLYASTLHDPFEVDLFDLTGRPPATTTTPSTCSLNGACEDKSLAGRPRAAAENHRRGGCLLLDDGFLHCRWSRPSPRSGALLIRPRTQPGSAFHWGEQHQSWCASA